MYENADKTDVFGSIKEKYPEIADNGISELLSDIDTLKAQRKLYSRDTFSYMADNTADAPLKALCLNVSHNCNMTCGYCFVAGSGSFNTGGLMSFETGKRAIDFLAGCSGKRRNLDIDFFGGEPLLNWRVVKDIVAYARGLEKDIEKKFRFTLTTNGWLIDDDVINFTNREMHNVVLSIDGRPETHDAFRRLEAGHGSFNEVVPKIKRLVQARREKGYYIRGTFTRANLHFASDILYLADLGFTELSFEPVVTKPHVPFALTLSDLPVLLREYELLAQEMLRRRKAGNGFSFYHFLLDLTGGPCVSKRIAGCGVGREYLAVTPQGELYPCHQFIGNNEYLMGDVWHGITNTGLRMEFGKTNIYTRDACRGCWARFYCSGGCAANSFNASDSIGGIYELGCELFKKRAECAIMMKVAEET